MTKLLACMGLAMGLASTGCTLYFGEDHDDDVQVTTYCEGTGPATTCYTCYTQPDGYQECFPDSYGCTSDNTCAPGCYCDEGSGICEEAGYCGSDAECGYGMECDCSGSCVPANTATRTCEPTPPPPPPPPPLTCNTDVDCAAGCYCENGVCEESSVCTSDSQCPAGQICDEPRGTCIPLPPLPPPPPPPPACSTITDWGVCQARTDCVAVVNGTNCHRPDGTDCQMGDTNCVCEIITFEGCVARPTGP